ncbi:helix-turn-helix domain-containing protein [Halobacillus ihumii]|uniref:helix-turn-helix domain-containing protein n=1 Tax=Halobacillus ihumii TaxID=2686092 RepID=UPI0013D073D6|nr:helix-turn-helix transcriptional regulator [Halobacillus ihumii]
MKGHRLKELRKAKGMSQSQLAESLNSSRSYISQIEGGHVNPSINFLTRIAEKLDCSVQEFF